MPSVMTPSLPIILKFSRRSAIGLLLSESGLSAEHDHLDHKTREEHEHHRRQDPAQASVLFFLFVGVHGIRDKNQATILVAVASNFGGVSKVWKGAGEGTSHSKPSAPSQGFWGAFSP